MKTLNNVIRQTVTVQSTSMCSSAVLTTGLLGRCGLRSWCQTNLSKGVSEI